MNCLHCLRAAVDNIRYAVYDSLLRGELAREENEGIHSCLTEKMPGSDRGVSLEEKEGPKKGQGIRGVAGPLSCCG